MISCRTKGIPMKEGTRVDAEGYHCFNLDETKHDPFAVLDRLMAAVDKASGGERKTDPEADKRYEALMTAREFDCSRYKCASPAGCKQLRTCGAKIKP